VTTKERRRERYAQEPEYREREKSRRRAYEQANKEELSARRQFGHLERRYGISRTDYQVLLAAQRGVCPVCGKRSKKTLCVDHCHATGTVRGLLCRQCNFGLGCLGDDQAAMIAALAYLGGGDGDCAGSAAQRALAARAALPPGVARMTIATKARWLNRFDAAPLDRSPGIGGRTSRPMSRKGAVLPTNSCDVPTPPNGGANARPLRDALAAALRRKVDDGNGRKVGLLELIARKLAAKALDGDLGAIREIFDRIDGKPVAAADADEPPGRVILQWKDPEQSRSWPSIRPRRQSATPSCESKGSTEQPATSSRRCRPVQPQTCGESPQGHEMANMLDKILKKSMPAKRETH
jgi:hypothetical protein